MPSTEQATRILRELAAGDPSALDRLLPVVYEELHDLASRSMRHERGNHTLQPTALVHEAYLRLVRGETIAWENRAHFFGAAARCIRQILINHARDRRAAKRGGGARRVTLHEEAARSPVEGDVDLLEMDEALTALAEVDERRSRVVELRFFGGLTVEEAAHVLGVSARTVESDWRFARAWLRRRLEGDAA